jgi:uncharacterized protein involved in exopolysaccharide biosynthesis
VDANNVAELEDRHFIAMVATLWRDKWLVAIAGFVCAGIAAGIALAMQPVFRAEASIREITDDSLGGAGYLVSRLGGLPDLAGATLGGLSSGNKEGQAVLNSRRLVEQFIDKHSLIPVLLPPPDDKATLWLAVQRFRNDVLSIREERRDGLTVVAMDWKDPVIAAAWANDFVALANETLRARALDEAKRNIAYLGEQASAATSVEVQRAMYNLIESETKKLMLANGRAEFAFSVVDPAVPPERRLRPRRTLMALVGGLIGLFLGAVGVLARAAMVARRTAAQKAS